MSKVHPGASNADIPARSGLRRSWGNTSNQLASEASPDIPGYFNAIPSSSTMARGGDAAAPDSPTPSSPEPTLCPVVAQDEGQESLPAYTCSLRAECVFRRKMEMRSPFSRAEGRSWTKVFVVLKGTMLSLHRVKDPGLFASLDYPYAGTPDRPLGSSAGRLIRSYTLQNAEVGIAVDYQKRDFVPRALLLRLLSQGSPAERELFQKTKCFVIRLRVEADQFLLSCSTVHTLLYWLECLNAAIDLAPPLDERSFPSHRTIPVRRRRRVQAQAGAAGGPRLMRERPLTTAAEAYTEHTEHTAATRDGPPGLQLTVGSAQGSVRPHLPSDKSSSKWKWRLSISSLTSVSSRSTGLRRALLRESTSVASLRAGLGGVTRAALRESNSIASPRAGMSRAVLREQSSAASLRAGLSRAVLREQSSMASIGAEVARAVLREQASVASMRALVDVGWPAPRQGRSAARQMVDAYDGAAEVSADRLLAAGPRDNRRGDGGGRLERPSSAEAKWRPPHNWSYARHVRYARRCMTNLGSDAPRRSDIIVKDGQRWKIRWDLGRLVVHDPEKPPGYDDVDGEADDEPEPRAILCF